MQKPDQQSVQKSPCSVCHDALSNASIDGCEHQFCLRCIRKWAKNKNTCPLCRAQFLQIKKQNRRYRVTPPPPPPPRQRLSLQTQAISLQRRFYLMPIPFAAQHVCYFFNPTINTFVPHRIDISNMHSPIALPSFYIPS